MKSDNSKLIEIYEKYCTPFKLQEEVKIIKIKIIIFL